MTSETHLFGTEGARIVARLTAIYETLPDDSLTRFKLKSVIDDIEAAARERARRHAHLLNHIAGQATTNQLPRIPRLPQED